MDPFGIGLGFAHPDDAQALAFMARDLVEAGLGWTYRKERIGAFIADPEAIALVARRLDQRAGFAVMTFGEQRAHLVLMAVHPAWQRRGVGRRMLTWLIESAMVAGVSTVGVEMRADNRPAYGLYRALGFEEISRVPRYYAGRETAVRMVRVLRFSGLATLRWRPPTHDRH